MESAQCADPIMDVAELAADRLAEYGYAFVEDDRVRELAEALSAFLRTAGIPVWVEESVSGGGT